MYCCNAKEEKLMMTDVLKMLLAEPNSSLDFWLDACRSHGGRFAEVKAIRRRLRGSSRFTGLLRRDAYSKLSTTPVKIEGLGSRVARPVVMA